MSSGLNPSGVSSGSVSTTLELGAGNDTAPLSTFASAPELTSVSTFTRNSTVVEVVSTPSPATIQLSRASTTTVSLTSTLVRATLVKITTSGSSSSTATLTAVNSTVTMVSSSSVSTSPALSSSSKSPASSPGPAASTDSASAAPSTPASAAPLSQASSTPSPSSKVAASLPLSPVPSPSSSSSQHAGAEAPVSSASVIETAASSGAGTVSSSSTGEKSGPLSAPPSPASSSPAPSSPSITSSTDNSNESLSSGSSTITAGPSQAKSASAPNVIDIPGSTTISTVTEAPETTFSRPVSIAVTASDGRTAFSAPPLVTSVLPSTRTDGMVVQVTHVIANPNSSLNALSKHSFFDNAGAVAGTFVAVGVVATALAALLLCLIRRRRRRARQARLESRLPHFPFRDEPTTPQTAERRSISIIPMNMDDPFAEPAHPRPSLFFRQSGSAEGRFVEYDQRDRAYEGPFADYRPSEHGHGAFGDHDAPEAIRAPSRAVSTPSIYPPSLPDDDRDQDSIYGQDVHISPPLQAHGGASVSDFIPLERRNPLRPSTADSGQMRDLDARHPPLLARPPPMVQTSSYGYASSSTDHGSSTDGPQTPRSESATAAGSIYSGDEKDRVGMVNGLHRPASPQSVFLRRQLSKPLAESFSIPAELRRMSLVNETQDYAPVAL
ncbi:unnamed protein product [Peniophora sp. CBMAI 1063]|nr:unnamed protein product [Peniophora sp. CBMAI 1063]